MMATRWGAGTWLSGALLLAGITLAFTQPPAVLLSAEAVGYAVCHQIPARSFLINAEPMPLCARCSGSYLGAAAGFWVMIMLRRERSALLPPTRLLAALGLFVIAWGVDGLNSFSSFFPTLPTLYQPQNLLRLITGLLQGIAIATLMWATFHITMWEQPDTTPILQNWRELGLTTGTATLLGLGVLSNHPGLLFPLAILSALTVLLLLTLINTIIVAALLREDGRLQRWRQLWPFLSAGLALAIGQVWLLGVARSALIGGLDVTF